MKNRIVFAFLIVIIAGTFPACAQTKDLQNRLTDYNRIDLNNINEKILQLVNEHRKSIGKGELKMLNVASMQAVQHSKDMMNGATPFGHKDFDKRVDAVRSSIGFINAAAENVAYGQTSAEQVVDGWLHSPGHRMNIEGDYNLTGIGVTQNGEGVLYFTQIFVLKK